MFLGLIKIDRSLDCIVLITCIWYRLGMIDMASSCKTGSLSTF